MRILVIEDEPRMLELLRKGLHERDFAVMTAADGKTGLELATTHEFEAIVLDIGLPCLDGYGVMQALRARGKITPVLMLTARDAEDDIIRGLDAGADDYLTKPFSFPEFIARLQSITRYHRASVNAMIEAGDVVVDPIRRSVTREARHIELSRLEFLLLVCLVRRAGECVPRQAIANFVWGPNHVIGATALDVLVNSLRAKLDAPFRTKTIGTVRGMGYVFQHAQPGVGKPTP
jgi:DNA-binding response OmpR family regulator